jgi:hypothetical protein
VACLVVVSAVALFSADAAAHKTSRGASRFILDEVGGVRVELDLSEQDILDLLYIDLSSPEQLQALRAGQLDERLESHLRRWLKLTAADEARARCPIEYESIEELKLRSYRVHAKATCARLPERLQIDWGLANATDLKLVHVGSVTAPGDIEHKIVLSKRSNKHLLVVKAPSVLETFVRFLVLGAEHIALGWDHLAFLLALVLGVARLRRLLLVVSAFTVAHSVTLGLGAAGLVEISPDIVEPIIALSIAVAAAAALVRWRTLPWPGSGRPDGARWPALLIVLGFGLLHGLGFASMLQEALGPGVGIAAPLVAFNLGVELGQVVILAVAFPLLVVIGRRRFGGLVVLALLGGLVALGLVVTGLRVFG